MGPLLPLVWLLTGEPDVDVEGAAPGGDECPALAETWNGYRDGDGCPDELPRALRRVVGRLALQFRLDRPWLRGRSLAALGAVADALDEHADVRVRLVARVVGAARVQELWAGRVAAARACLVAGGVAEARIEVVVERVTPAGNVTPRRAGWPGIWLELVVQDGRGRLAHLAG